VNAEAETADVGAAVAAEFESARTLALKTAAAAMREVKKRIVLIVDSEEGVL